jgi:hypothetical protein
MTEKSELWTMRGTTSNGKMRSVPPSAPYTLNVMPFWRRIPLGHALPAAELLGAEPLELARDGSAPGARAPGRREHLVVETPVS